MDTTGGMDVTYGTNGTDVMDGRDGRDVQDGRRRGQTDGSDGIDGSDGGGNGRIGRGRQRSGRTDGTNVGTCLHSSPVLVPLASSCASSMYCETPWDESMRGITE